jgi:hypothetical protein
MPWRVSIWPSEYTGREHYLESSRDRKVALTRITELAAKAPGEESLISRKGAKTQRVEQNKKKQIINVDWLTY